MRTRRVEETREAVGLGEEGGGRGDQLKPRTSLEASWLREPSVCRYEKLEDEKDKLLRFADDSKTSAFKSLLPLQLETRLTLLKEESKEACTKSTSRFTCVSQYLAKEILRSLI